MKAGEIIQVVDSQLMNERQPEEKIAWINELTNALYTDLIFEYGEDRSLTTVKDQFEYVPDGYIFEDIETLKVNNQEYTKSDIFNRTSGTYFKSNGKIALEPTPNVAGQPIAIVFRKRPEAFTTDTIDDVELPLPVQFHTMYEYFLKYKILLVQKEYGEANNYMTLYNNEYDRLAIWYGNSRAKAGAAKTLRRWG